MKVYLSSIGCRLNQSEIETIGRQLLARGHQIVDDPAQAEQVIINTCAVTHGAARDARTQTRQVHRHNPDAVVYLTGCYATIAPGELQELPGKTQIVANQDKHQLIQILDPRENGSVPTFDQEPILREYLHGRFGNTRAFVKVQDGCDNACTFCVTTVARGAGSSRRVGDVVAEIQALGAAGYQEVVLTGVHLGSYGKDIDDRTTLHELVKTILQHTDLPRIRLSSLEPWDIAPDFFDLWQDQRLQPHLHLPLQSGSDAILRRMARRTSRRQFRALVAAARTAIPDLSVSTDIILGFPGESEDDFKQSMDFVQELAFSRLHAFTYSRRPKTAAARMPDQIPAVQKKARTKGMIALGAELSLAFHKRFEGQIRPVLWENAIGADDGGLRWAGYTDNYIRVIANGPADLFNRIEPAALVTAQESTMSATLGVTQDVLPRPTARHGG